MNAKSVFHALLIEDNPSDVMLIREAMRRAEMPFDVEIAYNGEEGLKLLESAGSNFDLVILDLNLPKFSGLAILEQYRVQNGPPVVVFSGSSNPFHKEAALALGARDFVVKPSTYEGFIRAVRGILEKHAAHAAVHVA